MSRKTTLAVLFGGRAAEHSISFKSALYVMGMLPPDRYAIQAIYVKPDGSVATGDEYLEALERFIVSNTIPVLSGTTHIDADTRERFRSFAYLPGRSESDFLADLAEGAYDACFPVFHGQNGGDGLYQGLFEFVGVPYAGCDLRGSVLVNDKVFLKRLCTGLGIPVCPHRSVRREAWDAGEAAVARELEAELAYPLFIKPPCLGSSIGVTKATDRATLLGGLRTAFGYSDKALVEQGVAAREFAVGVIGNTEPVVSEPGEFMLNDSFFDYEAKFGPESLDDLVPAPLEPTERERLRCFAKDAYQRLGLNGMARIDCFLTGGRLLLNEINTVPGMSAPAVFMRQWQASGMEPGELFDRVVRYGLEAHSARRGPWADGGISRNEQRS